MATIPKTHPAQCPACLCKSSHHYAGTHCGLHGERPGVELLSYAVMRENVLHYAGSLLTCRSTFNIWGEFMDIYTVPCSAYMA